MELSDEDARALSEVLTAQLHSLRFELSAADARKFREDLRARLVRLEQITARLAGAMGDAGEQPIAG